MRTLLGLFVALAVVVMCGCGKGGGNSVAPARVSGPVTYKGKPVRAGTVVFHTEDGKGGGFSTIGPDGTYEIVDLPIGKMSVTVDTEDYNPAKKQQEYFGKKGQEGYAERMAAEKKMGAQIAPKGATAEYTKIPQKYANPRTSPLVFTLEAGRQVRDIELKD